MSGGTGGLPVLLLSLAVLDLTLETMALLPNTSSSTAATLPPSSPATSTAEMPMDAFTPSAAAPQGSSPEASSITTAQERGSTAHSTAGSPGLGLTTGTPTGVGLTTGTPTSTSTAITPNCPKATNVTSVGTSTAPAFSSFGAEMSTLPPPTSTLLSSTLVGTTVGTSTHQGPATTTLLGSTSPRSASTSSPTTPALTDTSNKPLATPSDTTASLITSTVATKSTPAPSQPVGTTARTILGTSTLTAPETPSATAGIDFSFPTTNSAQTSEVTRSTPADLPMPPPVCPTGSSNTSASRLFLSLRLSTPLDLGNSTVQELVLSKLRKNLQTAFPCAGLSLEWRGKRSP
ncbi:flocculation protein FLO11-like isoform X2 [Neopelma chrysocephalum]|uniref:flocculation protein FLO11-like isoform X2 n=1 Tax=Neopelma chrysocephalum TaxID=114329 RepID=UPI000FCCE8A3|nr:flocculation protein FLO11-like isoform X2 [Neopelma chrysocephalum]